MRAKIVQDLKLIIEAIIGMEVTLTEETTLFDAQQENTLGLSSLDMIHLYVSIEKSYGIDIEEDKKFNDIKEIVDFILEKKC